MFFIMKIRFLVLIVFLQVNSCCLFSQESNGYIPIINFEITDKCDSATINFSNYWKSVPISIMENLSSSNIVNYEFIYASLLRSGDSVSIINTNTNHITFVKINDSEIVDHIYFYNYDSIFVFLDRDVVIYHRANNNKIADFYMIDTLGEIKGLYSLDSVPYIYHDTKDTMIFLRRFRLEDSKIKNNIFYIPFSLYKPHLNDSVLASLNIELLCAFDLQNKKVKMLNIKMPDNIIGTNFSKNSVTNGFDFIFINDTTMLYSYDFSSDIYKFNIKTDSSELIKSFPDFPFNNIPNPKEECFSSRFGKLKFSPLENVFYRDIFVRNFENYKDFNLTQVLDDQLNLVGYYIENSSYCCLERNGYGEFVLLNVKKNYFGSVVKIGSIKLVPFGELVNNYLPKKPIETQNVVFFNDPTLSENQIIDTYISEFKIPKNSKVVIFKFDNCGYATDYLIKQMAKTNDKNPIYYIVYGENCGSIITFLESMKITNMDYIKFDLKNIYKGYIKDDIRNQVLLVKNKKNKFKMVKSNNTTLYKEFKHFM